MPDTLQNLCIVLQTGVAMQCCKLELMQTKVRCAATVPFFSNR